MIASAGSEEKIAFLRSIGTDVAFNYKTEKTLDVLRWEGPIDMCVPPLSYSALLCVLIWIDDAHRYWDNVGGESLEAALDAAAWHARFIVRPSFVLPRVLANSYA